MARVIQMSDRELNRLRVMIDLADDRLTVDAAATLMGLGRRQIYRLRRAFSANGPAGKPRSIATKPQLQPESAENGGPYRIKSQRREAHQPGAAIVIAETPLVLVPQTQESVP